MPGAETVLLSLFGPLDLVTLHIRSSIVNRTAGSVARVMCALGVAALVTTTVFDRRAGAADAATIWRPALRTTWQWQLTGSPIDTSLKVQMYDVDLFDTDPIVISTLHSQGRKAICYMSAGTWEDWRPDANQFPASVKGQGNGWEGEKWLDIRNLDVLGPIMEARMDLCKAKGFDGVEPDNVDGYANTTGFPLSNVDQMKFNTFLANAAHARGLSVGLKNDLDQVKALEPLFDWALNEECFRYNECPQLTPFVQAGKAVFHVEYNREPAAFCPTTTALGFSSMKKKLNLDAYRVACDASLAPALAAPKGLRIVR